MHFLPCRHSRKLYFTETTLGELFSCPWERIDFQCVVESSFLFFLLSVGVIPFLLSSLLDKECVDNINSFLLTRRHAQTSILMGSSSSRLKRQVSPSTLADGNPLTSKTVSHQFGTFVNRNVLVIWLDGDAFDSDVVYQNCLSRLRRTFPSLTIQTDVKETLKCLSTQKTSPTVMIISSDVFEEIWPKVKNFTQVQSIYILSVDGEKQSLAEQGYTKVKGIYSRVESICSSLTRGTKYFTPGALMMSVVPSMKYSKKDLPHLNQLFIYWMMGKQILLETKYETGEAMTSLTQFSRTLFADNPTELKVIEEFERTYRSHTPMWWYTRPCFLSPMLSRAIQTQDIEIIIRMGFFIKDLHQQLEKLHSDPSTTLPLPIVAYRSQNLSSEEFKKMKDIKGNLLTFSNFILADPDHQASLALARRDQSKVNCVCVLFRIKVESRQTSSPFASLSAGQCYSPQELGKFLLFSLHSVFRIVDLQQLDGQLWQIDITLTDANEAQIVSLAELLRQESRESSGWFKLGRLMTTLRDFDRARDIYFSLLEAVPENELLKLASVYNELGLICDELGDFASALSFYQKAFDIRRRCLPPNHRSLSVSYNNMGEVHRQLGDYYNALATQKKALDIKEKILRPNDPAFAVTYNNIALANESLGDFAKALEFYQKALDVRRRVLHAEHLELAIIYNNIGELYRQMGDFPTALKNLEKSMNIRLKKFPPTDASLAVPYNNIGLIHRELGDYPIALSYLNRSLQVKETSFPANHPSLALTHNNIGDIHQLMGEYPQALISYRTAWDIQAKTYAETHPELGITLTNVGVAHQSMGNHSEALSFYKRALLIRQKALPAGHPLIAVSLNNIGHAHQLMGQYNIALDFYQKAQRSQERSLPATHPALASTYNNLADVHRQLNNYSRALAFYKKSLEIKKKSLPPFHPTLVITYNNMGVLNQASKNYPAAIECYKQTLEIQKRTLSPNHPEMAAVYNNMSVTYQSMKENGNALEYCQKALEIQERILPGNHPDIAITHNSLATTYVCLGEFRKALEHAQRAVEIGSVTLAPDHPHLLTFRNYLERIAIKVDSLGEKRK